MLSKHEMREFAQRGIVTVHFVKKDGTNRKMVCTLLPEYIIDNRQLLQEGDAPKRAEHPDVLSVWDIEANDWRSFNVTSVTQFMLGGV